jgi:hypothetical protein
MFHFVATEPPADYGTPELWNVCFSGVKRNRWLDRFLKPGFRHVFLVGFVTEFGHWLLYEVLFHYSVVAIVSGDYAAGLLTIAMREGDVLTVRPEFHVKRRWQHALGFWCVPAIRHVLGLRCVAITPFGLHRYLLARGAVSLKAEAHEQSVQSAESQTGPVSG